MNGFPDIKKDERSELEIISAIVGLAGVLYVQSDVGQSLDRLMPWVWSLCNKYDITINLSIYDCDGETLGMCAWVSKCDGLTPEPRFRKWHGCGQLEKPTRGILLALEEAVIDLEKTKPV